MHPLFFHPYKANKLGSLITFLTARTSSLACHPSTISMFNQPCTERHVNGSNSAPPSEEPPIRQLVGQCTVSSWNRFLKASHSGGVFSGGFGR